MAHTKEMPPSKNSHPESHSTINSTAERFLGRHEELEIDKLFRARSPSSREAIST
jgi:hypothetical protein